ncbi:MAG: helix-turn-helix domain-containing protein [Candidatus Helarchaeales archaeon]
MVDLISRVLEILRRCKYQTLPIYHKSSCFDITARGEGRLLFIKCLHNVDNFRKQHKEELKIIADACQGVPLIIGEVNKQTKLQDQVVYETGGIPVITFPTFMKIIVEKLFPHIYSKRGGQFVQIDNVKLGKRLKSRRISTSELARRVDISRRTINYYLKGEMDASIDTYRLLEKELEADIKKPINIFDWYYEGPRESPPEDDLKSNVDEQFRQIGLQVLWTKKAPFDGVSEGEIQREVIITGVGSKNEKTGIIHQKISLIQSISSIINSLRMFIVEDRPIRKFIHGVPVLTMSMLEEIEDAEDLKKKISKKGKKTR